MEMANKKHLKEAPLKADEQSRKAFYFAMLSLGSVRPECDSGPSRSSRGRQ